MNQLPPTSTWYLRFRVERTSLEKLTRRRRSRRRSVRTGIYEPDSRRARGLIDPIA